MTGDAKYGKRLVVGETRRLTAAAVLMAGAIIIIGSVVEYLTLAREIAGGETPAVYYVRQTFTVTDPWTSGMWVSGYLLVIALAAVHTYFNLGYLPSVLLAVSPNVGVALWSIHGFDEYVALTPLLVFDRVLPEGPLVATTGFLLGLALRAVLDPTTPSQQAEPAAPEQ